VDLPRDLWEACVREAQKNDSSLVESFRKPDIIRALLKSSRRERRETLKESRLEQETITTENLVTKTGSLPVAPAQPALQSVTEASGDMILQCEGMKGSEPEDRPGLSQIPDPLRSHGTGPVSNEAFKSRLPSQDLHPLDLEYKRLRNVLLTEKIETQKGLRVRATNQALHETIQCHNCGAMLLKEQAWQHIRIHHPQEARDAISRQPGYAHCFIHNTMEPVNSLCFPKSREEVLTELHGGVYPSGLTER
jgi:hypothetical protein